METHEKKHEHGDHANESAVKDNVTKDSKTNNVGAAIIVSALILGGAFYLSKTKTNAPTEEKPKNIVASLGISETAFQACYTGTAAKERVLADIASSDRAAAHIPADQGRGTPYSVAITKDGRKVEIAGAYPIEAVKGIIDELMTNKAKNSSEINLDPVGADDHYFGSKDAEVVIVEYSDLECPYCAKFHQTMHQLITDYNGKVAWVYRHLPLKMHENAEEKAVASECVSELGGNDAFWKYIDNIFEQATPKKKVYDPLAG